MKPSQRIFGLDLLRAIAILAVVYEHGIPILQDSLNLEILEYFILDGVSIFFVLSGFLIGGIIKKTFQSDHLGPKDLLIFWWNRWMRTLPPYVFILTLLVLIERQALSEVYVYYLFIQSWASPHPNFFPEAWSLAVEEWFYLIVPTLVIVLRKLRIPMDRILLTLTGLFMVASFLLRTQVGELASFEEWSEIIKKPVIYRLDSILFGVLGVYFYQPKLKQFTPYVHRIRIPLFITGISLILGFTLSLIQYDSWSSASTTWYYHGLALQMMGLGTLLTLPLLVVFQPKISTWTQVVTHISLVSYGIYLVNLVFVRGHLISRIQIRWGLNPEGPWGDALELLLYLGLTYLMALGIRHTIELPMLKLRDRLAEKMR